MPVSHNGQAYHAEARESRAGEDPAARRSGRHRVTAVLCALLAVAGPAMPAAAQVSTVDPDAAIDADLGRPAARAPAELPSVPQAAPASGPASTGPASTGGVASWNATQIAAAAPPPAAPAPAPLAAAKDTSATYREDDLIGAAEGVFGKGASGLADLIKDLLSKQGQPNGYIVGREAGGAIAVGLRYGSGTLHHKVEGTRPVYWTGPSLGIDAGANAGNAFVLVYNLYDTQDLFHRYGAGEGQAYLVGGFNVSYLRRKDVVLIPVRMGAGLRLGANVGYMKFSEKLKWVPF